MRREMHATYFRLAHSVRNETHAAQRGYAVRELFTWAGNKHKMSRHVQLVSDSADQISVKIRRCFHKNHVQSHLGEDALQHLNVVLKDVFIGRVIRGIHVNKLQHLTKLVVADVFDGFAHEPNVGGFDEKGAGLREDAFDARVAPARHGSAVSLDGKRQSK